VDLSDVAHELYGLLPGDFTAERNARAKDLKGEDADLAAQVKALPKPTTAGWLVNQLVRHHGDEVEQVAAIGSALRDAQEHLDRDELLQLNKQRHGVLRAVTRQARALAKELGNPVSTAIADEVEQTLRAVMSDPDAADAVRSGTMLKSLSSTGFGSVDLTDAVAVPQARAGGGRRPAPARAARPGGAEGRSSKGGAQSSKGLSSTSGSRGDRVTKDELAERRRQHEREQRERERAEKALAEARQQAEEAESAAAEADDALDEAQASVEDLESRQAQLEQRLHDLEQDVRDAQSQLTAVQRETRTAERERDRARHESEVAHRAADRARTRVERLS
jgi:chromosome segregation ATPase